MLHVTEKKKTNVAIRIFVVFYPIAANLNCGNMGDSGSQEGF